MWRRSLRPPPSWLGSSCVCWHLHQASSWPLFQIRLWFKCWSRFDPNPQVLHWKRWLVSGPAIYVVRSQQARSDERLLQPKEFLFPFQPLQTLKSLNLTPPTGHVIITTPLLVVWCEVWSVNEWRELPLSSHFVLFTEHPKRFDTTTHESTKVSDQANTLWKNPREKCRHKIWLSHKCEDMQSK